MKKRLLAILLIVALVLATALTVSAGSPFDDVKTSDWFYDEVVYEHLCIQIRYCFHRRQQHLGR